MNPSPDAPQADQRTTPPLAVGYWGDARKRMARHETSAHAPYPNWLIGTGGVLLAASLFLAAAVVLGGCLTELRQQFRAEQHTENVLLTASSLQSVLDEAVAAARGYAVGRDSKLIVLRERAIGAIWDRIDTLRGMVRSDSESLRKINALSQAFERRMRAYDQLIALISQGATADRLAAGEMERLRVSRAVNDEISSFRVRQSEILSYQRRRVDFDMSIAVALVLFTGLAAPIFGFLGAYLLRRERDSRRSTQLQMELMHVQRLAIMGETAAMLAHELNQPLAAATNYLSALGRQVAAEDSDTARKTLSMAERAGQQIQRAVAIVKKLRKFIEKPEAEERSLELPAVLIEDAIVLLGTIDNGVELKTRMDPDLPYVLVDRVQLQQVLVNLMRNAIEAMHDTQRRELTLSVMAPDARTVEISLAATGPGLPSEVAERLFPPFVSTKPNGMGVGLSICRSIIAQHQGRIWADPNPGGGTVFHFTLPVAEARAAA